MCFGSFFRTLAVNSVSDLSGSQKFSPDSHFGTVNTKIFSQHVSFLPLINQHTLYQAMFDCDSGVEAKRTIDFISNT